MIAFIGCPVERVSSKLLFSGLFQQRPRGVRVANRGLRVESEDFGEVEGVGAMDEDFFEPPVDAELMVVAWPRSGVVKETALIGPMPKVVNLLISRCGLAVSGQRQRRWSSHSLGDVQCQRVQRPDPAVDHELAIADVEVVE
ncbi:hypothetical protein ACFQ6U_06360 [Streptomyces sp. NPDC056465]|uniref:hypothetical protein n=1 Tax=unclassified Streptomyces TaxID=2593676 RepID=UPI0035D70A84